MSIYNDVYELENLLEASVNMETGEISEEDYQAYLQLKQEILNYGLEKLAKVRANVMSDLDGLKAEIDRLKTAKERAEKKIENIEEWMLSIYLPNKQKGGLKCGSFTVGSRLSKQVVLSDNFDDERFMTVKTTKAPNKIAIKEYIESGRELNGAKIVEVQHITIK